MVSHRPRADAQQADAADEPHGVWRARAFARASSFEERLAADPRCWADRGDVLCAGRNIMGLILQVGTAADVFTQPFADRVAHVLQQHFGKAMRIVGTSDNGAWQSAELGWSDLRSLQDHARSVVDTEAVPHLLSMPAWRGAFLPVETAIGELTEIWEPDQPIAIASLLSLDAELRVLSRTMGVPYDEQACHELFRSYRDDDDRIEEDPEVQMLTQLIIGTHVGLSRQQPLWVVK